LRLARIRAMTSPSTCSRRALPVGRRRAWPTPPTVRRAWNNNGCSLSSTGPCRP